MFLPLCVILCTRGGGWLPIMHGGLHQGGICIQGVCLRGGLHLGGCLPPGGLHQGGLHGGGGRGGQSLLRDTWDITGYGHQAGSTHSTGMYSFQRFVSSMMIVIDMKEEKNCNNHKVNCVKMTEFNFLYQLLIINNIKH